MPRRFDPDENLAPHQRRAAIAALLARGILRLRPPSESASYSLELGAPESAHAPSGMARGKEART